MTDMDDEQGAAVSIPIEVDERVPDDTEQQVKTDKPRGKCTGCAFDYQLGTARTGEHKGKQVIRKHNSRVGPGLCSGAQQPPEGTLPCGHMYPGPADPSVFCALAPGHDGDHRDGTTSEDTNVSWLPQTENVVGVAPGGTPITVTRLDADGAPVGEPFDAVGAITLCPSPVDPFTAPNIVYSDTPHEVVQDPDSTNGTLVLPTDWSKAVTPRVGADVPWEHLAAPHPQSMTNGIDAEPTPENVMETVVQGLRESRYIPSANPVPDVFTAPGPVNPRPKSVDSVLGPWTTASFDGPCDGSSCRSRIVEGEEIRADGSGGWLCEPCGEDAEIVKTSGHVLVEAPPVVTVPWVRDEETVAFAVREYGSAVPAPLYTDPNASRYEQDDNPGTVTSVPALDPWTPTGTVLDRMTPEQRAEALGTSSTVIGIHAGMTGSVLPVMPPVSISEVHAENPPRQSSYPFTAPAPASLIPESSTTVSGQPEPDRDRWGRYLIMGTAHTRATTFAKLGANTKAIEAWNERNVIRGLTLRPDLLMLANGLEVKRDRNDLNSIAAQAKDAAGSKVAANIGTAYHAFSERLDAGLITFQDIPYQYQGRVFQYDQAIKDAGLTTRPEWIERTTAVRADQVGAPLPVAGTLDRIFQLPDGSLVIGDLKTGSDLSYGEMEIEVQLALYAHGVNTHGLFDWNTKTWQRLLGTHSAGTPSTAQVRTDIAIVVHLPADGDGCTLYVADIERGWRDAQRLGPLQASLKEKKRFRTLTAADLAPRPTAVEHGEVAQYLATQPAPPDSKWELAKGLISSAPSQAAIAQLYQFALDSGEFHVDQLAVLVGLGKGRLDALARG